MPYILLMLLLELKRDKENVESIFTFAFIVICVFQPEQHIFVMYFIKSGHSWHGDDLDDLLPAQYVEGAIATSQMTKVLPTLDVQDIYTQVKSAAWQQIYTRVTILSYEFISISIISKLLQDQLMHFFKIVKLVTHDSTTIIA